MLAFRLTIPEEGNDRAVTAYVRIYDIVGNLVQSADQLDLLSSVANVDRLSGHEIDFNIYWGGQNIDGLPVAPGVYRAVVYIDYASPKYADTRLSTNVGISR
jgi:hypothetical protein